MVAVYGENSFRQSASNVMKYGAYYTDADHCRRIGNLFDFEQAEEICILEPSIGDAQAVLAVTGERKNCRIYGVEIQRQTYQDFLDGSEKLANVLNEDFLRGVKISHGVFSFAFMNPPYGESHEYGKSERLESQFLDKVVPYLKNGAYLALVIPFYVFSEETFFRSVLTRFEICNYYRFDDRKYAKYKQVVVILRKKQGRGYLRSLFEESYPKACTIANYGYLPRTMDKTERYVVMESREDDIDYFTTMKFKPEYAVKTLHQSPLFLSAGKSLFQSHYTGCDLNQPIVPVSNDISYLLAVTGGGQGLAGKEEDGTLHLQRGVAKRVEEEKLEKREDHLDTGNVVVKTSYTKIILTLVENDGTITRL